MFMEWKIYSPQESSQLSALSCAQQLLVVAWHVSVLSEAIYKQEEVIQSILGGWKEMSRIPSFSECNKDTFECKFGKNFTLWSFSVPFHPHPPLTMQCKSIEQNKERSFKVGIINQKEMSNRNFKAIYFHFLKHRSSHSLDKKRKF